MYLARSSFDYPVVLCCCGLRGVVVYQDPTDALANLSITAHFV
jgi:hypothetical protein